MLAFEFFSWWYGAGWREVVRGSGHRLGKVSGMFSVPILLRTLFAPWRRIISYPGASLDARFRAMIDNLISRTIGFLVRILVLVAALILLIVMAIVQLVEIIIWPLLPLAVVVLLVLGTGLAS